MARTVATLPAGARITDYISLVVITKAFPLSMVRAVLAAGLLRRHQHEPVLRELDGSGRKPGPSCPVALFETNLIARATNLLVDSTGLKLGGAGEWLVEKHGTSRRRSWRKLHLGVDAESGAILAIELTRKEIDDAARSGALLDQITDPIASFTADGAYDQDRVYETVAERALIRMLELGRPNCVRIA